MGSVEGLSHCHRSLERTQFIEGDVCFPSGQPGHRDPQGELVCSLLGTAQDELTLQKGCGPLSDGHGFLLGLASRVPRVGEHSHTVGMLAGKAPDHAALVG